MSLWTQRNNASAAERSYGESGEESYTPGWDAPNRDVQVSRGDANLWFDKYGITDPGTRDYIYQSAAGNNDTPNEKALSQWVLENRSTGGGGLSPFDAAQQQLAGQIGMMPQWYAAEAEFQPKYAALERQIGMEGMRELMPFYENYMLPASTRMAQKAQTSAREGDIADVEALGGRAATAAREANPQLWALMGQLNESAAGQGGMGSIRGELERQALSDLQLGSRLSPAEKRDIIQGGRAAYSDRGMLRGQPGVLAEAIDQYMAAQQRQGERRQFAQGVLSQSHGEISDIARLNAGVAMDPYAQVLGRPALNLSLMGEREAAAGQYGSGGPSLFDPYSSYGQSGGGGSRGVQVPASARQQSGGGMDWLAPAFALGGGIIGATTAGPGGGIAGWNAGMQAGYGAGTAVNAFF